MQIIENILSAQWLFVLAVSLPALVCAIVGVGWLAGWTPKERTLSRFTSCVFALCVAALLALSWRTAMEHGGVFRADLGDWFRVGHYVFPLILVGDRLSLPLLTLTAILLGLIGSFSSRYVHRERGFLRFFFLLHLFAFGAFLAFAAGSMDLLIFGWELVGLTSAMLVAFFQERREPVGNSLRVFATYRLADVGLMSGAFMLHSATGMAALDLMFRGPWPLQSSTLGTGTATAIGLLFLASAIGKSAQVPVSGWLPRAMEGPTPSSAIFYGAIAVHLGVYLLLRAQPILSASPVASAAVVSVGFLTAIHATLSGRASSDAKTSLAYAAMAQLGVVFMEVGLGFHLLALIHVLGHAIVRTLQFLRAPSMLHDYHRVHAAAGGPLPKTGTHYDALLPLQLRLWFYRLALERGHLDSILDRFVIAPLVAGSVWLGSLDGNQAGSKDGVHSESESNA